MEIWGWRYLHDGCPEVHSLRPNLTVPELGECASCGFGDGRLSAALGHADLRADELAHCGAEAQTETGGHAGQSVTIVTSPLQLLEGVERRGGRR